MKQLIYADITYKIRKSVFKVYNTLGYGHKEIVYQKALSVEFDKSKIAYQIEPSINVFYEGNKVGNYKPDFLVENKIIIEIKALEFLPKLLEKQLIYYLKSTGCKLGLLVNFDSSKIIIKRLIWTSSKPKISTIRANPLTIRDNLYQ